MSISAMKCALQSLEAVERTNGWNRNSITGKHCSQSIHFLRQAIEQAEQIVPSDYSNSHQRKWVGLTDCELPEGETYDFDRGVRWAEAKLKEKNA